MAKSNKNIVLAIDVQQQEGKAIQEAATIANNIMRTQRCLAIFNCEFGINVEIQEKMKDVLIRFDKYTKFAKKTKSEPLSWTARGSKTVHIIRLNEKFGDRLATKEVCYGDKEWQIIVVALSICIVHEVAHLIMRWKGYRNTPIDYVEAGNYVEKSIFNSLICPLIYKINENDDWTSKNKFEGK